MPRFSIFSLLTLTFWIAATTASISLMRSAGVERGARSKNLAVAYGNSTRQRGRVGFVLADASGFQNRRNVDVQMPLASESATSRKSHSLDA